MPICEECGADVPQESAEAHAEDHWPLFPLRQRIKDGDDRHFAEAVRRRESLTGTKVMG